MDIIFFHFITEKSEAWRSVGGTMSQSAALESAEAVWFSRQHENASPILQMPKAWTEFSSLFGFKGVHRKCRGGMPGE